MNAKYTPTKKDVIYILIFLVAIGVTITYDICADGFSGVGRLIERTILLTLSFVTLADVASCFHWVILVPDFFEYVKEKKRKQEIRDCIGEYMEEDINFLNDYSEERISFLMSQLGVNKNQMDQIRIELIKIRCMPLKNLDDARKKLRGLVKSSYPIMIDQESVDSSKLCYKKVKYYINTMDIMFMPEYAGELSSILAFLITEKIDLSAVDRLVVPHDSNFLLGVEVGKILGKPVVKIRHGKGKIETEKKWDGNLDPNDRVIIVHDVLVSGDQVIDAINKLPCTCSVEGVFCLITRTEWKGKERVCKKMGKKQDACFEVLKIDDAEINKIRKKQK